MPNAVIEVALYCLCFFLERSLAIKLLSSSLVAGSLGKFLATSITELNIGGIGLGSAGFLELQKGMTVELKLVKINIRFELIS